MRQYVNPFVVYSICARELVRKGFPRMIGLVQCSSTKKLVRISILLIVIGTPHTIPENSSTDLLAATIFAVRMFLGIDVIGSMAFSAVQRCIVFNSAPESSKLRNWMPRISMGTLGHSLRRCSTPAARSYSRRLCVSSLKSWSGLSSIPSSASL
jgi:hypothetical protein